MCFVINAYWPTRGDNCRKGPRYNKRRISFFFFFYVIRVRRKPTVIIPDFRTEHNCRLFDVSSYFSVPGGPLIQKYRFFVIKSCFRSVLSPIPVESLHISDDLIGFFFFFYKKISQKLRSLSIDFVISSHLEILLK